MRLDVRVLKIISKFSFCVLIFSSTTVYAQKVIFEPDGLIGLSNSSTYVLGNGTSLINNSVITKLDGTFVFDGPNSYDISGDSTLEFNSLIIENNAFVNLLTNVTVDSAVNLNKGIINLADKNLILLENAKITGNFDENSMFAACGKGQLSYRISKGGSYFFPIGDTTNIFDYSPAILTFTEGKYDNAVISVNVKNQFHPSVSNNSNYLNRYWSVNQTGITDFICNVDFAYVNDDLNGNEENMYGGKFTGKTWKALNKISSNEITGTVNNLSDFSGGKFSEIGASNSIENFVDIMIQNNSMVINPINGYRLDRIEIINQMGQVVYASKSINSDIQTIDMNGKQGFYLLRVFGENGIYAKKFVMN